MDTVKEFLTITEFAKAAGKSRQTIYNQIDSGILTGFVKELDGAKVINKAALQLYKSNESVKSDSQIDKRILTEKDKLIDELKDRIKEQAAFIKAQQQQIEEQAAELKEERQHSREISDKLTELTAQAQQLHAGTLKTQLQETQLIDTTAAQAQSGGDTAADQSTGLNPTPQDQSEGTKEPVKKSLFSRLFGRK
jgi:hypothetical protein